MEYWSQLSLKSLLRIQPFHPFHKFKILAADAVCASLLEGKVAILVDNTPFVLIVPMTFWTGLQAAEDYYERSIYTTFVRWIRLILINISLFLPSLYVAITTFHPKLIPTNLLISIVAREGIPFPAVIEALMMEFLFEGLREAGFGYQNLLDQQLVLSEHLLSGKPLCKQVLFPHLWSLLWRRPVLRHLRSRATT